MRNRSAAGPASKTATATSSGCDEPPLCVCCLPANYLVPRDDLGIMPDGTARFAICVVHLPEPMVYRGIGGGHYSLDPDLVVDADGNLVDKAGRNNT